MLNWQNCISENRKGKSSKDLGNRTSFQRDYDRLIFSSAFRRLQNKTQVFPLPGNTFVHNRLTHSLEVASVGRSIGAVIGDIIADLDSVKDENTKLFYRYDLPSVIAAACLAHDLGNPPFGHSGEKAISAYFISNAEKFIGEKKLMENFSVKEWSDLINFEGNANAFHVLNYAYSGKSENGMQLTNTTLASILKYPCEAQAVDKKVYHRKKFGYFQCDEADFLKVASQTNMIKDVTDDLISFKRHPFVYLVEAADDICYRIIDMEDAHRINILKTSIVKEAFLNVIDELAGKNRNRDLKKINEVLTTITDENEQVAYLRAKCINTLVYKSSEQFIDNKEAILNGTWNSSLLNELEKNSASLDAINVLSINSIYDHHSVIEVEIAGYKVMSELLDTFITAELDNKSPLSKKISKLIPQQYHSGKTTYEKVLNIVDYIAGMTDGYATEMYRNFKGIEIKRHSL